MGHAEKKRAKRRLQWVEGKKHVTRNSFDFVGCCSVTHFLSFFHSCFLHPHHTNQQEPRPPTHYTRTIFLASRKHCHQPLSTSPPNQSTTFCITHCHHIYLPTWDRAYHNHSKKWSETQTVSTFPGVHNVVAVAHVQIAHDVVVIREEYTTTGE